MFSTKLSTNNHGTEVVGIIGAGKMGCSLIKGLINSPDAPRIWAAVRSEQSQKKVQSEFDIPVTTEFAPLLAETTLLVLSVKPKGIVSVCESIRAAGTLPSTTPVISVAAGVSIQTIEQALGASNAVIRAMPNTPCQIQQGMTILCRKVGVPDTVLQTAHRLFETVGTCVELEEGQFDAATSVSASGPAFVFLIIEALVDAAVQVGLPRGVALQLVTQCLIGSTKMVGVTQRHPAALRDDVTTPGGCTITGVMALEQGSLRATLARAISETAQKASLLGGANLHANPHGADSNSARSRDMKS